MSECAGEAPVAPLLEMMSERRVDAALSYALHGSEAVCARSAGGMPVCPASDTLAADASTPVPGRDAARNNARRP